MGNNTVGKYAAGYLDQIKEAIKRASRNNVADLKEAFDKASLSASTFWTWNGTSECLLPMLFKGADDVEDLGVGASTPATATRFKDERDTAVFDALSKVWRI